MKRVQGILLAVVLLLGAVVTVLALRNRQAPVLPNDADHRRGPIPAACLECHDTGGSHPRSKNHPVGNDCMRCHGSP